MSETKVLWLLHPHLEAQERRSMVENTPFNHKNISME
jgi:hypothetical protein